MQTLFSIRKNKKIPKDFWDKTDVDRFFYHNILDITQFHHRKIRVSKGSNKVFLLSTCFTIAIQSYSSDLFSRLKSAFPKRKLSLYSTVCVNFSKHLTFDRTKKVSQIPLPEPNFEIGCTKAKKELVNHHYKDIAEHLTRQFLLSFRFEKKMTRVLSFEQFEQYGDQFILTEVVNLGYREIKHL